MTGTQGGGPEKESLQKGNGICMSRETGEKAGREDGGKDEEMLYARRRLSASICTACKTEL
jgi:hypothetical protein